MNKNVYVNINILFFDYNINDNYYRYIIKEINEKNVFRSKIKNGKILLFEKACIKRKVLFKSNKCYVRI